MHGTGLPVGLGAWNVAGHTTTSVADALVAASAIALVARAVGVVILAVLCTRLPVCLGAWNVAHDAAAGVAASVA